MREIGYKLCDFCNADGDCQPVYIVGCHCWYELWICVLLNVGHFDYDAAIRNFNVSFIMPMRELK